MWQRKKKEPSTAKFITWGFCLHLQNKITTAIMKAKSIIKQVSSYMLQVSVSVMLRHRIHVGAMIWRVESDLVAMVRERGLETFEFLCGYSVFIQVVPINSCLYKEWVFILIGSTQRDHYTFTVVSYRGCHYIASYTIVKLFCSDLTFWFLVFNK
jgi:hypothetical protein